MRATPRNLSALFVDTVVDHMGDASVSFGVDPPADEIDAYIAGALAAEDSELLDYETEISCSVDGDAAWKVTYDDVERRVRVTSVPPETLWIQSAPDDRRRVELVAQRYKLSRDDFPVLFPNQLAFGTKDAWVTEEWTEQLWRVWLGEAVLLEQPNPYGFLPYIHIPNYRHPHETWGRGDPERIRHLQDRLNYAESDADDVMALAGSVVVLEGVDDTDNLSWRPGVFWQLPPEAKASVLDLVGGSAITQRLDYINRIRERTHDVGRVPTSVLGNTARNLSGVALQTELGPLIRLVARKRRTRTAALRRRAQLIAALGAKFDGLPASPTPPTVTWSEAIPSDRADELANAESEMRLGRDIEAVLASIGVDDPAAELTAREAQNKRGLPGGDQDDPANPQRRRPADDADR